MIVSLVICTKDRPYYLEKTLLNILGNENNLAQIIIIDASQGSKTKELVEGIKSKSSTQIIYRNCSPGLPKQKNLGIEIAFIVNEKVDAITFLDDDILVAPDYFSQLQAFINESPAWTAFTGVSLSNKRARRSFLRRFFYLDSKKDASILKSGICTPIYSDTELLIAEWLPGASMTINPKILNFEKFNERIKIYYEDTEMSIRLNQHGPLYICHKMKYEHSHAQIGHESIRNIIAFSDGARWMLSRNHNNDIQMFAVVWSIFGSSLKAALELIVARKNLEKKEVLIGHLIFMTRLILRRHLVSFPNKNELS
jgi:GT2 family glycosyltransferase